MRAPWQPPGLRRGRARLTCADVFDVLGSPSGEPDFGGIVALYFLAVVLCD
jgi:hypothetical protein